MSSVGERLILYVHFCFVIFLKLENKVSLLPLHMITRDSLIQVIIEHQLYIKHYELGIQKKHSVYNLIEICCKYYTRNYRCDGMIIGKLGLFGDPKSLKNNSFKQFSRYLLIVKIAAILHLQNGSFYCFKRHII